MIIECLVEQSIDDDDDDSLVRNENGFMSPFPSSHTTALVSKVEREYVQKKVSQVKTISVERRFSEKVKCVREDNGFIQMAWRKRKMSIHTNQTLLLFVFKGKCGSGSYLLFYVMLQEEKKFNAMSIFTTYWFAIIGLAK